MKQHPTIYSYLTRTHWSASPCPSRLPGSPHQVSGHHSTQFLWDSFSFFLFYFILCLWYEEWILSVLPTAKQWIRWTEEAKKHSNFFLRCHFDNLCFLGLDGNRLDAKGHRVSANAEPLMQNLTSFGSCQPAGHGRKGMRRNRESSENNKYT